MPTAVLGQQRKVTAATGLDAYYAPYAVAARHKIFEKHGLQLDYKPFDDGSVALDALLTGNSHMGSANQVGGLTRWDKTKSLYIAGVVAASDRLHAAIATSTVQKPEDLIGKSVAIPQFTSGHYMFNHYAKKHNLPIDQIKIVRVAAPELVAAMSRGDIHAFFSWEPWLTRAMTLVKGAHPLVWANDMGLTFTTLNYYSKPLVEDHQLAVAVTKGLIEAAEYCEKNREEAAKIVSQDLRIPENDARDAVNKLTFRVEMHKDKMLPELIDYANFCLEAKLIKEMPNWSDILRPQIMKDAAPDRLSGW
jgi:ABC-type nitrate/sulfonate/bicarbonate transport system substrate-binding protein